MDTDIVDRVHRYMREHGLANVTNALIDMRDGGHLSDYPSRNAAHTAYKKAKPLWLQENKAEILEYSTRYSLKDCASFYYTPQPVIAQHIPEFRKQHGFQLKTVFSPDLQGKMTDEELNSYERQLFSKITVGLQEEAGLILYRMKKKTRLPRIVKMLKRWADTAVCDGKSFRQKVY